MEQQNMHKLSFPFLDNNFILGLRKRYSKIATAPSPKSTTQQDTCSKMKTVHYASLPDWLRLNEYLHYGHRPPTPSIAVCVKSIFSLHTETLNVWTHLLASLGFFLLLLHNISIPDIERAFREKLAFSCYLIGLIIAYGLSAFYHTFNCYSQFMFALSSTGDYFGIIICKLGIAVPGLFYLWWCRLEIFMIYSSFFILLGLSLCYLVIKGVFYGGAEKSARAAIGVAIVVVGISCMLHEMMLSGFWKSIEQYPLKKSLLAFFIFVLAIVIYSTRIPERWWPGKFDIWFHSHQIFHVLAVVATGLGYHCVIEFANCRITQLDSLNCTQNFTWPITGTVLDMNT